MIYKGYFRSKGENALYEVEITTPDSTTITGSTTGVTTGTTTPMTPASTEADVDTDAAYTADTEVVKDGYFHESESRSAPYFDVQIDGITLLNSKF